MKRHILFLMLTAALSSAAPYADANLLEITVAALLTTRRRPVGHRRL